MRRFAKLWGFALFCIFVVYIFRDVALPFLFAVLVAYILAPLVDRMASCASAARPFPRGLAVIFLYINILAGLGLFIGYFIPKLSGGLRPGVPRGAAAVREAEPGLAAPGGRLDRRRTSAPASQPSPSDDGAPPTPDEPQAPRAILVEPLADGRYRIDLEAVNLEVKPAESGSYLIAPPAQDESDAGGGGKWERSIKQWIADAAEVHRRGEPPGAGVGPEVRRRRGGRASRGCSWC